MFLRPLASNRLIQTHVDSLIAIFIFKHFVILSLDIGSQPYLIPLKYQRFRRLIMGNVIQTNVSSLGAQRALNGTNQALGTTFQRLSTGLRINSAKDDAAGLQISTSNTQTINL